MGLDMYAFAKDNTGQERELKYWRKHNRLQGWMENLWREKGQTDMFNCQRMPLTEFDLIQLREDIESGTGLDITPGFFYGGEYEYDEKMREEDLQFVEEALQVLHFNGEVYYSCWW